MFGARLGGVRGSLGLVFATACFSACRAAPSDTKPSPALSASAVAEGGAPAPSARGAPSLPPLTGLSWLEQMPLDDGSLLYVSPALGATEPRPVVVALHGAGDRAEWSCGGWRVVASEYAFVVCPQGLKMDAERFGWDSPATIERRVEAALAAVHARFGAYVAEGPTLYVGFSQGATMAGPTLLAKKDRFPVVALAEGGYNLIRDTSFLQRLKANGTSRLLIVCGSPACFQTANSVRPSFARIALDLQIAGDPLSGHNLNQRMQAAVHPAWPSLVAGLPNWQSFPKYLAARPAP
jgi:predicted esterase